VDPAVVGATDKALENLLDRLVCALEAADRELLDRLERRRERPSLPLD
jgi:hypothetical protein